MGLLGAASAMLFQWWTSAVDYPLMVGGKPMFSWQAFVPILFEVTVLFSTFTAGLAMLFVLNKLPYFGHPVLATKAMASITRDRFALSIEAGQGALDFEEARRVLERVGAVDIEVVRALPADPGLSNRGVFRVAAMIALACGVAGAATYGGVKVVTTVAPISHIQNQPKLNAQKASSFFPDGRGLRMPVAGTGARGYLPYPFKTPEEAGASLVNPLPRTEPVLEQGRRSYNDHCAVCHGTLGNGETTLSSAYGAKPANLQSAAIRQYPDGQLYHVIMVGKNAMPGYEADLSEDDRWAIVHYLRVLQRSQNAHEEDVR
jgi:mono/diheme cytochrome c family protein